MKEKLDVKSIVTLAFTVALIALVFIAVFKSETIFESVFLLFTNMCTAVFTYFFAKRKEEPTTTYYAEPIETNAIGFQQPDKE